MGTVADVGIETIGDMRERREGTVERRYEGEKVEGMGGRRGATGEKREDEEEKEKETQRGRMLKRRQRKRREGGEERRRKVRRRGALLVRSRGMTAIGNRVGTVRGKWNTKDKNETGTEIVTETTITEYATGSGTQIENVTTTVIETGTAIVIGT